jgi:1-acyl-sn-glycerol-3-phosphate acyltransferase
VSKARGLGGRTLGASSPLFGGAQDAAALATVPEDDLAATAATASAKEAMIEEEISLPDSESGQHELPTEEEMQQLRDLLDGHDPERSVDDWGRSERIVSLFEPLLNFYYRYWFRVETEGIENVPSEGGALLVANHSGALPPDAPMVMQAIRNEHPNPRPLYMFGEHWFKGYPGVGMLVNKLGLIPAHRDNAQRLLNQEGGLAIVFPEGQKGTRKVYWQRYRLRRFGRGGFVRSAIRARVPIVPIALVGGEEAMPIFAHIRPLQRLSGLIYFPLNHAFPHFGLAAALMYMPAKFKIRFLEPVRTDEIPVEVADDPAEVQAIAERIRGQIQRELDRMVAARSSVWLG